MSVVAAAAVCVVRKTKPRSLSEREQQNKTMSQRRVSPFSNQLPQNLNFFPRRIQNSTSDRRAVTPLVRTYVRKMRTYGAPIGELPIF